MDVYVHDPFFGIDEVRSYGYKYSPILQDALEIADYVCLHVPKSAETVNLIGKPELASMKPTATLINVSRGGIVDEAALFDALSQGRLAGAALDVFEPEPPLTDNPLLSLDSVVLSPHCAAFTRECGRRMSVACARNVLAAFDGSLDPALVVNPETLG
jgi:D-3-phosphoglycerate dehydrogenase